LQFSDTLRNNRVNQVETTIGGSPILQVRSGPPPANCAAADVGVMLCQMALPSDWLTNASAGMKAKNGTWAGVADVAAGPGGTAAGHFRIKSGATTHMQGSITGIGGGGNMTIDNVLITSGQAVNVATFSVTDGNG